MNSNTNKGLSCLIVTMPLWARAKRPLLIIIFTGDAIKNTFTHAKNFQKLGNVVTLIDEQPFTKIIVFIVDVKR